MGEGSSFMFMTSKTASNGAYWQLHVQPWPAQPICPAHAFPYQFP